MKRLFIFILLGLLQSAVLPPVVRAQFNFLKGDSNSPRSKYKSGETFPKGGYRLHSTHYGDVYLKSFPDNDSLYYLQYPIKRYEDGREFYFLVIDEVSKDSILEHSMNKDAFKMLERIQWLNTFLKATKIFEVENRNSIWTKSRGVPTMSMNPPQFYGGRYHPLTYKKALQDYKKRNSIGAFEALGAIAIFNILNGSNKSGENKYSCGTCGATFSDQGALRSHQNAIHDY